LAKKWLFFYNFQFLGILAKIAASAHFGCHKFGKKQNIKKSLPKVVENTLRYIFAQF
jgi:hypothetical protein